MKLIICEDNQAFAKQIESYISNFVLIEENSIEIVLNTSSPKEVEAVILEENIDCFFLDIDLGQETTGLDLAKKIRRKLPLASIIFITTHSEMLYLTFKYQVEALDFILKDDEELIHQAIIRALKTAFKKYMQLGTHLDMNYFQVKVDEYVKNINLNDIIYFKIGEVAHKVTLLTLQGQFEFYQSLNEIENFNKDFFRCHRGYIINLNNIQEINSKNKEVRMKDGSICPISFRKLADLKRAISK